MHKPFCLVLLAFLFSCSVLASTSSTVNDFGTLSVISGSLLNWGNFSEKQTVLWQAIPTVPKEIKSHFHLCITNILFLAAGIISIAQVGTLRSRRSALYLFSAVIITGLALKGQYYFAWLSLWGILHSAAHHLWPFITIHGLNVKATAFPDVAVHLIMHGIVHSGVCSLGVSEATKWGSFFVLLGCAWNCYLSYYSRVDEVLFVKTSCFQALSSGGWVGYLLAISTENQGGVFFETFLWTFWIASVTNWFLFKHSAKWLKKLFAISYLDTLFIIPVWLYIANNWVSNPRSTSPSFIGM